MMNQNFTMLFWRKPSKKEKPFEQIAEETYKMFMVFMEKLPENLRPNFKTVSKLGDAKLYDWSFENFSQDLEKGVNHTRDKVFRDLGYSLSFFSSLDNKESCGYMAKVGVTRKDFIDTFIVEFPVGFDYFSEENASMLEEIFCRCLEIFNPYYACFANSKVKTSYSYLSDDDKPLDAHWLNYFSHDMMKHIKKGSIKRLERDFDGFEFHDGFIKIQRTPLNAENQKDLELKEQVEGLLFDK